MTLNVGDQVHAVEHDETTRTPREGGLRLPARVVALEGPYVQVRYDDTSGPVGTRPDVFWADSLWRAWDGAFRWRLEEA